MKPSAKFDTHRERPSASKLDLDALTKDFVTGFFPEFIQFAIPLLHAAVDWAIEPVFLEQELLNMMKGKYRIKGKRKNTDKLVKLRLKSGSDHFVLDHSEFQHQPEENFGRRMYTYSALTFLKHELEAFTAIALFTGKPPQPEQLSFQTDVFGTRLSYTFNAIIAANQDEGELLASTNPFALGILAMKYAYLSEGKPEMRLEYKKKLFRAASEKGIGKETLVKLLIFVRDFVHLPSRLEENFYKNAITESIQSEEEAMYFSPGTKRMLAIWFEQSHGYNPVKEIAKIKRKAKKDETVAREAAAREAAAREAAIELHEAMIYNLFKEGVLPKEVIAKVANCSVAYVEEVIDKRSKTGNK